MRKSPSWFWHEKGRVVNVMYFQTLLTKKGREFCFTPVIPDFLLHLRKNKIKHKQKNSQQGTGLQRNRKRNTTVMEGNGKMRERVYLEERLETPVKASPLRTSSTERWRLNHYTSTPMIFQNNGRELKSCKRHSHSLRNSKEGNHKAMKGDENKMIEELETFWHQ